MVRALLAEIDKAGMAQRVTVQSFDWRSLALVGQWAPQLPRAYLTSARTLKDSRWTSGLRLEDFGSAPQLVKAAAGDSKGAGDLVAGLRRSHARAGRGSAVRSASRSCRGR